MQPVDPRRHTEHCNDLFSGTKIICMVVQMLSSSRQCEAMTISLITPKRVRAASPKHNTPVEPRNKRFEDASLALESDDEVRRINFPGQKAQCHADKRPVSPLIWKVHARR
jgi:hypothetical protein